MQKQKLKKINYTITNRLEMESVYEYICMMQLNFLLISYDYILLSTERF